MLFSLPLSLPFLLLPRRLVNLVNAKWLFFVSSSQRRKRFQLGYCSLLSSQLQRTCVEMLAMQAMCLEALICIMHSSVESKVSSSLYSTCRCTCTK